LVFIAYVESVGDLGTGAALVRWPDRWREVAQITLAINLAMAVVWFLLTLAVAPAVAAFFGSPDGVPVLRVLAWTFLLKALGNTHDALLQRDLRFRARAIPELGLLLVKAAVAIPLAAAGFGVWSLVWGQLVGQALWTVLLWVIVPWRPGREIPRELIRPVFGYGRGIVAVNVLAVVVHHVDVVMVGRLFGPAVLGFYQMAEKLPDIAVTLLVRATSKVLFPAFSRLHAGGEALRDMYASSLRYLSLLTTPAAVGLVMLAEPIVLTVFGAQWLPSVPILRALAVYAGIRALSATAGDVLKAIGRPGVLAGLGVVRAIVLIPALYLASAGGPAALAAMLAAVMALSTVMTLWVVCRLAHISAWAVIDALRPGVMASALLAGALALVRPLMQDLPHAAQLGLGALSGIALYVALVRVISPATWCEVREALARRRSPLPSAEPVLAEASVR
ncbi:MAG TPA: oligosaccharide flippase family protein, partial [Gemmatimonadaceae bacterium]|nr:oligosaccharide flippase family protein [Gemmatimonadaceae bacterium]